jgi:hypothetical protein
MRNTYIFIACIALWLLIGFGLPYLIHFKLNFLGANFVTPKDIFGLWFGTPIFTLLIFTLIYFKITETK